MKIKTIVIDPPWKFDGGGNRAASVHYDTVAHSDIPPLCIDALSNYQINEDAHCYIWVVNNHLDQGLILMEKLGFKYITNIIWVKNSIGMGRYFRGKHEICLFGRRGKGLKARTKSNSIPSVFEGKKRKHSQKPEEFYEMVEARSQPPYLELFSRHTRPGWTMWGNEIGKLDNNETHTCKPDNKMI